MLGVGATISVLESQFAQYLGSPVKFESVVDLSTPYSSIKVVSTCSNQTIVPSVLCSCKPLANLNPPSGPDTSKKELLASKVVVAYLLCASVSTSLSIWFSMFVMKTFTTELDKTSPGQACVFYKNDQLLGGGWITS